MGTKSLVALDTDHIKQYVFATDKLKEIRGASSILDNLNREEMRRIAHEEDPEATEIYANGGSGLFLVDADKADGFGQRVQQEYRKRTAGGATITYAIQAIPKDLDLRKGNIQETLELLRCSLRKKKDWQIDHDHIALPSHPFMRICDACGVHYAEDRDDDEGQDPANQEKRYCNICLTKRDEDDYVKSQIDKLVNERIGTGKVKHDKKNPFAWERVISLLPADYVILPGTERPSDFNKLRGMFGGKDYLALIYADGNGMGKVMEELETLPEIQQTAGIIDSAVYEALSYAISEHLKIIPASNHEPPMFPFDILLIGGDDIMIVTPTSFALDVAYTIANQFYERTKGKGPGGKDLTLSIGVVLAPVKYPFGMLQDLVDSTLKYAKKEGVKRQRTSDETFINFMTVTGSTSQDFNKVYKSLHNKRVQVGGQDRAFYATLRPYNLEELKLLLDTIRDGKRKALGRTKLHQVREAVLQMNLTTSVYEGMAVLRNWRAQQREFVMQHVYTLGGRYQAQYSNDAKPGSLFPRVTFPWFADGRDAYRTSLLDFVELYDFVALEGGDDEN